LKWENLIRETARRAEMGQEETARALDSFFDTLIEKMTTEDEIHLRQDFGYFEMREAGGEQSMHPQVVTKCHRTPVFKKASNLKKKLRQSDAEYCQMLREAGCGAQAERLTRRVKK
jgi:nucleoid DNA-binding protein